MLPTRVFFFGFLLIVILSVATYLLWGRDSELRATQQLLARQEVFSRAGASNIASFFQSFGDSLVVLAQAPSIRNKDAGATVLMDAFVEQWSKSGIVGGVVLIDASGIVRFNSNITGIPDVGESLADRDYFLWAKGKQDVGEYFVGRPVTSRLGATKGKTIIPVAAPVFRNGVFVGALGTSVSLNDLAENYLELMKVSSLTEVYLLSQEGEMLYGNPFPASETLGESLKSALSQMTDGSSKVEEHLVAFSPVSLGSQNWLLVMSSPAQEVSTVTVPIYIRLVALMLLVVITTFFFGVIVAKEVKVESNQTTS